MFTYVSEENTISNFRKEEYSEDGVNTYLQNFGKDLTDSTASHVRKLGKLHGN
jgi:hypothetical protein